VLYGLSSEIFFWQLKKSMSQVQPEASVEFSLCLIHCLMYLTEKKATALFDDIALIFYSKNSIHNTSNI